MGKFLFVRPYIGDTHSEQCNMYRRFGGVYTVIEGTISKCVSTKLVVECGMQSARTATYL